MIVFVFVPAPAAAAPCFEIGLLQEREWFQGGHEGLQMKVVSFKGSRTAPETARAQEKAQAHTHTAVFSLSSTREQDLLCCLSRGKKERSDRQRKAAGQ